MKIPYYRFVQMPLALSVIKAKHFKARPRLWEKTSGWDLPVFE